MRDYLVSYLRLLGFSVCALAVALCIRVGPAHAASPRPEPRFSAPPDALQVAPAPVALTEDEQAAALEARLAVITSEIANLDKVLEVLGPLPRHPDLFIPVMLGDPEPAAARFIDPLAEMPNASFSVVAGAVAPPTILGETARYDAPLHLASAPAAEDAAIAALCVELAALSGPPRGMAAIRAR